MLGGERDGEQLETARPTPQASELLFVRDCLEPLRMRLSVVINTYNRAASLRQTLLSLRYQTCRDFEVIVVNGPSTDETEEVLAEFAGAVRSGRCPELNLCKSRNLGIEMASGDIVAFIDDDAIADPGWVDAILRGYDAPRVGGVGGLVYDHTGYTLQYRRSDCNRLGGARWDVESPCFAQTIRGADPFVYLQGTNCSFRRECLEQIRGFDEEIEYYLDEVDVCMRVIDCGYVVRYTDRAIIHHKYLPSHLRDEKRFLRQPYSVVKNRTYFALQNTRSRLPIMETVELCRRFGDDFRRSGRKAVSAGTITKEEFKEYEQQIWEALITGIDHGLHCNRKTRDIAPARAREFRPYPTLVPAGKRLNLCLVSQESPSAGGIGRFSWDLAEGIAGQGHEVHMVTTSENHNRVDFEQGVWVHRIVPETPPNGANLPPLLRRILGRAAAVHREVRRINETRPLDLVSAPLWDCEGAFCQLDDSLPFALTILTTLKTTIDLNPSWADSDGMPELLELERQLARIAPFVVAPSTANLEKAKRDFAMPVDDMRAAVVPLGLPERAARIGRQREDDGIRVLFVGRLERRKGVDTLLSAATALIEEFPALEFVFVGNDTIRWENGETIRAKFERERRHSPGFDRVHFRGAVSEQELYQHYADCDIFCAPSRYESFGLVLIEAMMFGKPVVACEAGGMVEIARHGENGLLGPSGNVESLMTHLRRLIENGSLRRQYGERSRELYEERFSANRMVDSMLEAYQAFVEPPDAMASRASADHARPRHAAGQHGKTKAA